MQMLDARGQDARNVNLHGEFSNDLPGESPPFDDNTVGRAVRPNFGSRGPLYNHCMDSKNHGWIWYFVGVFVLAVVATGVTVWFNRIAQLTPETLEKAEALWKTKGPKDYLLAYTISTVSKAGAGERHCVVKVKDGKAYEAKDNGIKQEPDRMHYYGMPRMFQDIQTFLDEDAEPGKPKTYTRAVFDPDTGALLRYIRSVMLTGQRVEINVAPLKSE
jgi:Family of unknown function (DUF6174)